MLASNVNLHQYLYDGLFYVYTSGYAFLVSNIAFGHLIMYKKAEAMNKAKPGGIERCKDVSNTTRSESVG